MGVKCPYCFAITPVGIMGIYALPVNLTLVMLVNKLRIIEATDEIAVQDLCCVCKQEKAIKMCYSCDPLGCKLCEACCTAEHERGFAPVRAHRPILIKDDTDKRRKENMCQIHDQVLTHYSEVTGTFACQKCLDQATLVEDSKICFEPFDVVIQSFKSKLAPLMQNLEGYLGRVQESHHKIAIIQSQMKQAGPRTIQEIQNQFAKFQVLFQERQKNLLDDMEKFVSQIIACVSKCY